MTIAALSSFEQAQKTVGAELLRHSSIELTTNGRDAIKTAANLLPAGMSVYVPKLPRQTLEDKLVQIAMLREFGLEPIPHIAARQLSSELELRRFIEAAAQESKVHRVLVIGGDNPESSGPFSDSASVIASGILQAAGISVIDVAGYPEKHPRIPGRALEADLERKLQLIAEQNLRMNIVTQFTFNPPKMVRYCDWLASKAPGVPVIAGMAGPTSTARLLNYARICGVSTSLRAMNSLGMNAVKLAMHSSPDKQFSVLRAHKSQGETGNLAGVHLFSFGGFVDSAKWLNQLASECTG